MSIPSVTAVPQKSGTGSVANLPPGVIDNNTFDIQNARWSDDGTRVIDRDGEWIDGDFLREAAARADVPEAAAVLAIADARRAGHVDDKSEANGDYFNHDEMDSIIESFVRNGLENGLLDKHGKQAKPGGNSLMALAVALGTLIDTLTDKVKDKALEFANITKDDDPNKVPDPANPTDKDDKKDPKSDMAMFELKGLSELVGTSTSMASSIISQMGTSLKESAGRG